MEVYILTKSDYDSTEVVGVFSTEERGKEFRGKFPEGGGWSLDPMTVDELNAETMCSFSFVFTKDGNYWFSESDFLDFYENIFVSYAFGGTIETSVRVSARNYGEAEQLAKKRYAEIILTEDYKQQVEEEMKRHNDFLKSMEEERLNAKRG